MKIKKKYENKFFKNVPHISSEFSQFSSQRTIDPSTK